MTHRRFLRQRSFAKGFSELVAPEIRIVSKPIRAARFGNDRARDFAATQHFAPALDERRDTHVARSAIGRALECRNQQTVVLVIQRLTTEIRPPAPSLAANTGPSAKSTHLDA